MAKILKNVDTVTHTYNGQDILSGESYEIQSDESSMYANDSQLITDISNGLIIVNDGENDIVDVNEAINWLKDIKKDVMKDEHNRLMVVSKSQKPGYTTVFTSRGDKTTLNDGERLEWDASITDEGYWLTNSDDPSIPEGMKQHVIEISFIDTISVKEGTIYYMDVKKGSYVNMGIIADPNVAFEYLGEIYLNTSDKPIRFSHWLVDHPIQGDVPMGDELNTETCSNDLPNNLKFQFIVTVPESDTSSYGFMELEIYRARTVDLDQAIENGDITKI